jgi:hypothetical protein
VNGLTVLSITRGADTGGQSWRIFDLFRRLEPEWTVRSIVRPNAFEYIQYPQDLTWWDAKEWWTKADVVHLHNTFTVAKTMEQRASSRPSVIHYHGTSFRDNPTGVLTEQRRRGAVGIVSTLDLHLISPGNLQWLPSPYDLEWLASLKV